MSDTNYTRWYREGSASLTQNSDVVTGSNTYWLNANIKPGDMFTLDSSKFYEVENVDSNTQITLKTPYLGSTISGANYAVIRNFTATLPAETAAKVVTVLAKNEKYVDEPMNTLRGQSAYEIAVDKQGFVGNESEWLETLNAYGQAKKNGYVGSLANWLESLTAYGIAKEQGFTGTKDAWLESLIGAGEWEKLNKRTSVLDPTGVLANGLGQGHQNYIDSPEMHINSHTWLHNSIARGKNLGDHITDEQLQAIHDGTFDDMFVGDYWAVRGDGKTKIVNDADETFSNKNIFFFQIVEFNRWKNRDDGYAWDRSPSSQEILKKFYSSVENDEFDTSKRSFQTPAVAETGKCVSYENRPTAPSRNHIVVMASRNFQGIRIATPKINENINLTNTGYAYDLFTRGALKGRFFENLASKVFGAENFLTWAENLYTTFDSSKARPAGPEPFLCKIEMPCIAQLYGKDFAGLEFSQLPIPGVGHEWGGNINPLLMKEQDKFALFEMMPALSMYYPNYLRDYMLSNSYIMQRTGEYFIKNMWSWGSPHTFYNMCPYFCIGVDSDE